MVSTGSASRIVTALTPVVMVRLCDTNKHWAHLQYARYFDFAGEAAVEGRPVLVGLVDCNRQRIKPEFEL